jgi:hypothetical protein
MPEGLAIHRRWVVVLDNGAIVIDWGDGVFQDLLTGELLRDLSLIGSHVIQDEQLEWLKRTGNIAGFDENCVYINNLPEVPKKTIE